MYTKYIRVANSGIWLIITGAIIAMFVSASVQYYNAAIRVNDNECTEENARIAFLDIVLSDTWFYTITSLVGIGILTHIVYTLSKKRQSDFTTVEKVRISKEKEALDAQTQRQNLQQQIERTREIEKSKLEKVRQLTGNR